MKKMKIEVKVALSWNRFLGVFISGFLGCLRFRLALSGQKCRKPILWLSPEQNTRLGYWCRQELQSEQEDYISLLYEQSGGTNLHKTEQTCRLLYNAIKWVHMLVKASLVECFCINTFNHIKSWWLGSPYKLTASQQTGALNCQICVCSW